MNFTRGHFTGQGRHWSLPRFCFQYALLRNNWSKKFGVEYWTLPGSNSPWRPWVLISEKLPKYLFYACVFNLDSGDLQILQFEFQILFCSLPTYFQKQLVLRQRIQMRVKRVTLAPTRKTGKTYLVTIALL